MRSLTLDGRLLFLGCGVRNFVFGLISVILALYLVELGYDAAGIGAIFTAGMAGGALCTIVLAGVADRVGRRRVLIAGGATMVLAGGVFVASAEPVVLGLAAALGAISPGGRDAGAFLSVEQAILPQTVSGRQRTSVYASYNLVAAMSGGLGALSAGVPALLGLEPLAGYRLLLLTFSGSGLLLAGMYWWLSPAVECWESMRSAGAVEPGGTGRVVDRGANRSRYLGLHHSSGTVGRLAGLFALDAFAGGFAVQGLVAYWLHARYGTEVGTIGTIFFVGNLLAGLSLLAAAPLARRFGLIQTIVFTQMPSNLCFLLIPLMPNLELVVALLLLRYPLGQLDVPTRQSFTMAVVAADERSAAAGLTTVARNTASAASPALAGLALASPVPGLNFLICGGLKVVYGVLMLVTFRHIRPPEESAR